MTKQTIIDHGGFITMHPVQIADEAIYDLAFDIIEADDSVRSAADFKKFDEEAPEDFIMQPLHTADDPIMLDEDHVALVWCDPDDPDNADLMVAVILELEELPNGRFNKTPCGIIAGSEFQGVLQYRLPCCGKDEDGFSMLFLTMNEEGKIEPDTRDALSTEMDHKKLFEKTAEGIVINSHGIEHLLDHHRHPGQDCDHDHTQLPKKIVREYHR